MLGWSYDDHGNHAGLTVFTDSYGNGANDHLDFGLNETFVNDGRGNPETGTLVAWRNRFGVIEHRQSFATSWT